MITLTSVLLNTIVASSAVSAAAISSQGLEKRLDHDKVKVYRETVPDSVRGRLYLKHKPYLKVFHGCVPFPAMNSDGEIGGGLKTTGASEGHCSKSEGQVYARSANHDGKFAIMYSWYMPKDHVSPGVGHRHEWEDVVVWLSEEKDDAKYLGTALSAHGAYPKEHKERYPPSDGSHATIGYCMDGSTHSTCQTSIKGGQQPLLAWESMPQAMKDSFNNGDFGDAVVPFKDTDGRFNDQLNQAQI